MWIDRLTTDRTTRAVELAAQFAELRQQVLADNLANIDTPDHPTQRLDPEAFEASLRRALDRAQESGAGDPACADQAGGNGEAGRAGGGLNPAGETRLELRGSAQVATGPDGELYTQPVEEPAENVLFHDGTNAKFERVMADINENALSYELATGLLRGRYDLLLRAIRGRT
jgi:flagellar basal-body rod protein FlgB